MNYWFAPAVSRLLEHRDRWGQYPVSVVLVKRLPAKPDPWERSVIVLPFAKWGRVGLVRHLQAKQTMMTRAGMSLRFLLEDVEWLYAELVKDADAEHPIVGALFCLQAGDTCHEVMPLHLVEFAHPVRVPTVTAGSKDSLVLSWDPKQGMGGFDMGTC